MALPFFNKKNVPKDETGTIVLPEQLPQHVGFIMDLSLIHISEPTRP